MSTLNLSCLRIQRLVQIVSFSDARRTCGERSSVPVIEHVHFVWRQLDQSLGRLERRQSDENDDQPSQDCYLPSLQSQLQVPSIWWLGQVSQVQTILLGPFNSLL